jgi:hypothetical protein
MKARKANASNRSSATNESASGASQNSDVATSGTGSNMANDSSQAKQGARPIVPADVVERFWIPSKVPALNSRTIYRPAILAQASMHYVKASPALDLWLDHALIVGCEAGLPEPIWENAKELGREVLSLANQPDDGFTFGELSPELAAARNYKSWDKELKDYLYRHYVLRLFSNKQLKLVSKPNQSEVDVRIEFAQAAREARDLEIEKLRAKYATKLKSFENKIMTAQQRLEKEKAQAHQETLQSVLNVGSSILGALLGNKLRSRTNVTKAATAARGVGKAVQQQGDVGRVQETLATLYAERDALEQECQAEVDALANAYSPENLQLETLEIPSRKSDTRVSMLGLLWVPWQVDSNGIATPLVELA